MTLLLSAAALGAAYDGATPPALPDGNGGLAGLAEPDLATLRRTRDMLRPLVTDTSGNWTPRRDAVAARARLHEALNDWGRTGQLDFYLDALLEEKQGYVQAELAECGQCAAKARQPHFGGAHAFWRKLESLLKARGAKVSSGMQRARQNLTYADRPLRSAADLDCRLKPFALTLPKLGLEGSLRPYKVPKPPKAK